jgi:hypothetical protein
MAARFRIAGRQRILHDDFASTAIYATRIKLNVEFGLWVSRGAHVGHLGGNNVHDETSNFPNTQLYITQADFDFRTDKSKPKELKTFIDTARKNLIPNRDRLHFIKDGDEDLPGVNAILAPGHTVGHTIFMINSGKSALLHRRSSAPSDLVTGETVNRICVRHRSQAIRPESGQDANHAGGE